MLVCNTQNPKSSEKLEPYTQRAMNHLLLAKAAIVRATWLYPEAQPLPNNPRPTSTRHKLQRITGTLSLLVEAIKPLIATEPSEPEPPEPVSKLSEVAR
jgi:hypothetical protein